MMAKKKFDTNPLDPEFPDKVLGREAKTKTLPKNSFETAEFPTTAATEEKRAVLIMLILTLISRHTTGKIFL